MRPFKTLTIILFFFVGSSTFSQGFLRTKGTDIVNDDGTVIMRGIGTGNWMIQEGYMMQSTRAGIATQQQFEDKLIEIMGEGRTGEFYDLWLDNHFTKTDLDSMKVWGFNAVRVALHYKWFTPPIEEEKHLADGTLQMTWLEKGFQMTDDLLSWCEANQMYLVLDMHGAPGGQGKNASISDYDPEKPSLWESEDNKNKLIALWIKLADRYKDSEWIGGYDLINEPNWAFAGSKNPNGCDCENNDEIWDLHQKIIEGIRTVDQNHIVYISGNCWGGNYKSFEKHSLKNADDNLVVTFHKYWTNNEPDAIDNWLAMRETYQLPLWMSEGGENSNTWFSDCIALYEKHEIGWSWWPVKKSKVNNVLKVITAPSYIELIDSWQNNTPLSSEETYKAVMQYAENHKIENCVVAKDVIFAMTEQVSSNRTKPFVKHTSGLPVRFADYDMGREGYAYHDNVSSDTHLDDGSDWTNWNSGNYYRNDGVDIGENQNLPYVGWTESGEWMQYTINVSETGMFELLIRAASEVNDMVLKLEVNGTMLREAIELPATRDEFGWQEIRVKGLPLPEGEAEFKIHIVKGGGNLLDFNLIKS